MFDWLPTDGMAILGYVTAFLFVALVCLFLQAWEEYDHHKRMKEIQARERARMTALAARKPYKPIHFEV